MKARIWEFHVKEGCERQFEAMNRYNWPKLFEKSHHYRRTEIARNIKDSRTYVTADVWDSEEDFHRFLEKHGSEFENLCRQHKELYESARLVTPEGSWFEF